MGDLVEFRTVGKRLELCSEKFFEQALLLEQSSNLDQAIVLYEQAIILNPFNSRAIVNLGTIFFNRGELNKAEQLYRQAIAINPQYALAYFNLANILERDRRRKEEAISCFREAIAINPDYADAHYNLALLLKNLGRLMESAKHWYLYLKLDVSGEWHDRARRGLDVVLRKIVIKGGG